ncbi:hypothetical protein DICSQDRAFT_112889 [Dichomitus squalens LYAD-421 SS1]|uniref:WW domain-containing protein n=1 Tax=Dichomitus squalens (strain LYAD-421) TaxID=732165 RepID=R7SKC5_DICSQ|nr:uncharacterized protein DICSQDRAFT_112889 [Dichomitus squalens LYAD-421 SS1]EJF56594.1 hypothetical protein DICSQDRAFT_112889 [Dichomitus squalens LYAD-421 SS1]
MPDLEDDDAYVTFSSLENHAPEGWRMYTHPRGSIYFRNDRHKVIVDEDIRIPTHLSQVESLCVNRTQQGLPDYMEIYMAYGVDASMCLFMNHKQCVASYDVAKVSAGSTVRRLPVDSLLRFRRLYWNFLTHHPSHRPCHEEGYREAIDALSAYYHDHLIDGSRSVGPFSKIECEQLLEALQRARDVTGEIMPSASSMLGWILRDVYSFRTGQRYGQITWTEMRTYRKALYAAPDISTPESVITKTFLQIIIHGPFFGIPQTYLAHIKKASEFRGHVAGLRQSWEAYTRQLVQEYSDFILIATVLLSATVGLLTVNDIDSITRAAAPLSAFASLGSITIGVFFVWRHQRNNTEVPSSFAYLHNARNSAFGLSGHAILLSLPPVLLVWSIIAFAAAALAYSLHGISINSAPAWVVLAIFIVVFVAVTVGLYTFWTIWRWQSQDTWWRGLMCWSRSPANR